MPSTSAKGKNTVVITGIGMITSVGSDKESSWAAVRAGKSGVRSLAGRDDMPEFLQIGAPVTMCLPTPRPMKTLALCQKAAREALNDAQIDWNCVNRDRFACAISTHMSDTRFVTDSLGKTAVRSEPPNEPAWSATPWWKQWLPNTTCASIANEHRLFGPRFCHCSACASGIVDILFAVRAIEDGQCDIALAGSGEAIHPLLAAGFQQMRVLANHKDPTRACRPFDRGRTGFVLGEGAAMFVLERAGDAMARGARIYASVLGGHMLAEGHHVTDLDSESAALTYLINSTLRRADLSTRDVDYINAHGTGTIQNDRAEVRAIRRALGGAAESTSVSATKSMLGHLVNAAGSVELAITTLALRDRFIPPTINLTHRDPECDLDCTALVGRRRSAENAMKLSVAFGGHLAAIAIRRWPSAASGIEFSDLAKAA